MVTTKPKNDTKTTGIEKRNSEKVRMTFYITERNRSRLQSIPRGKKTELVNKALAEALSSIETKKNLGNFLQTIRTLKPVTSKLSSEEMIRKLRDEAIN